VRILVINWRDRGDPMGGGAETQLHEITRRLVQKGHAVTWIASWYPGAAREETRSDGIRYLREGSWRFANLVLPRVLRRELARNPYDVVLEDINKMPFYSPLHTKLPVTVLIPHLFGTTIFREANPLVGTYVYLSELPIPWVYRKSLFEVASRSTKRDMIKRGIPEDRIRVVENGMDHPVYMIDDPPPRNPFPTFIHLGRLRKYKSADVVVRAMAIILRDFPDARLNVVGDGAEEEALKRLARKLGIAGAVDFLGYMPRKQIVDLLYRTHIFMNPSPKEGWGLTVIEANECGVPVVASRRPGLVDSVQEHTTGLLARYGDPEDFAAKAMSLLRDPERWRRMSEEAVRWARSFSWDWAADETEKILRRSIEAGR
jgi:glycosyltransferase involved in cell wall biosynthesis